MAPAVSLRPGWAWKGRGGARAGGAPSLTGASRRHSARGQEPLLPSLWLSSFLPHDAPAWNSARGQESPFPASGSLPPIDAPWRFSAHGQEPPSFPSPVSGSPLPPPLMPPAWHSAHGQEPPFSPASGSPLFSPPLIPLRGTLHTVKSPLSQPLGLLFFPLMLLAGTLHMVRSPLPQSLGLLLCCPLDMVSRPFSPQPLNLLLSPPLMPLEGTLHMTRSPLSLPQQLRSPTCSSSSADPCPTPTCCRERGLLAMCRVTPPPFPRAGKTHVRTQRWPPPHPKKGWTNLYQAQERHGPGPRLGG